MKQQLQQYSAYEINEIISLYNSGVSFTKIGRMLKRQKNNIKKYWLNLVFGLMIEIINIMSINFQRQMFYQ